MLANAVDTEFLRLYAKEKEKNNVARGARTSVLKFKSLKLEMTYQR